ncbi:MAG: hypothetical protein GY820_17000 [Gammaproteobacteria bacterium]|nr:hypothetical protein [Gammaproteobacteria bacterium]
MIKVPGIDFWNRWKPTYGSAIAINDVDSLFNMATGETLVDSYMADTAGKIDTMIPDTVADLSAPGGAGWANWTEIFTLTTGFPCIVQFLATTGANSWGGFVSVGHPADQTNGRGVRMAIEIDGTVIADGYANMGAGGNLCRWNLIPVMALSDSQGGGYVSMPVLIETSIKLYGVRDSAGSFDGTGPWIFYGSVVKVAD